MNENTEHCRSIAEELYDTVNEIGESGLYEYFADAMDVDYLVDASLDYKGCRIMIKVGGPTVYVSTINHWKGRALLVG